MKPLIAKIKPATGFAGLVHTGLVLLLPLAMFLLVRIQPANFVQLALSLVLLSKWRMFAMRPRFWPAIIRANAVDIMVGVSFVVFIAHATSASMQFLLAVLYAVWLLVIKPATGTLSVSVQAMLGQLAGLMALFLAWTAGPLWGLIFVTGVICYISARHYFDSFDEQYAKLLAYLWAYFGAALLWLLGHWLLYYGIVAQPTIILSAIGYGLAMLYFFDHTGKLNVTLQRQFLFVMLAVVIIILAFSDWGDKVV
ncbi:MAG TPA: hypothetical protein VFL85_00460 [Candidatus Saccharimonadales bacterium]|nr:hypothetical protein [Candidatus Saccharimonadales bacterium]